MSNPRSEIWTMLTRVAFDHRDEWRRAAAERTGLPFSRIRVLRRLAKEPLTMKQLAYAASMDQPAATVAVNDLEARGLVVRTSDPNDRRCRHVALTDDGRDMLAIAMRTDDPPPPAFDVLDDDDVAALHRVLSKLTTI